MESLFVEHVYDLTRPKYAEKYEDSESGLKSIHSLAKTTKKHDIREIFGHLWVICLGSLFWAIGGRLIMLWATPANLI